MQTLITKYEARIKEINAEISINFLSKFYYSLIQVEKETLLQVTEDMRQMEVSAEIAHTQLFGNTE